MRLDSSGRATPPSTTGTGGSTEPSGAWFVRWLAVLAGLLLSWWFIAALVVPEVLRWAHEGRAVPFVPDLMAGRADTPLEVYLDSWRGIARGIGAALVLLGMATLPLAFTLPGVQERLGRSGHRLPLSENALGILLAAGILSLTLLVVLLAYVHPAAYVLSVTEDYWIEYGTFAAFFVACILFLRAAGAASGTRRWGLVAFAAAAFFVAFDEISWGQRILGLSTPQLLEAINTQGELTLHNIWSPMNAAMGLAVAAYVLGIPWLAGRGGRLGRLVDRFGLPVPRPYLWPGFLVSAGLFVLSDFNMPHLKVDEVAELAVGVCALLLGLDLGIRGGARRWPTAPSALLSGTAAVAVVALLTAGMIQLWPNPGGLTVRLHEFAAQRYPEAGLHRQAEMLFAHLERHPERRTRATRLAHGRLLLEWGDEARAEHVLAAALQDQRDAPTDWPAALAEARRKEGEIQRLLGRVDEADAAFQEAAAIDRTRLESEEDPSERAAIHWSLAQTLKTWGHVAEAAAEAARACELSHERRLRRTIYRWKVGKGMGEAASACDPTVLGGLSTEATTD